MPSILVPYPHATADHQTSNARQIGAAARRSSCPTTSSTARAWRARSAALLGDDARLRSMGSAARELARPDAAQTIAREVLAIGGER